jgi:hypothetical protein
MTIGTTARFIVLGSALLCVTACGSTSPGKRSSAHPAPYPPPSAVNTMPETKRALVQKVIVLPDADHAIRDLLAQVYRDKSTAGCASLRNWTQDDLALWSDYSHFARHYIARAMSEDMFELAYGSVYVEPVLKDSRNASPGSFLETKARSKRPTLEWHTDILRRPGSGSSSGVVNPGSVTYDLEIYDRHRLICTAEGLTGTRHKVTTPLERCQDLRWTVRPVFEMNGETRYGVWKRYHTDDKGNAGHVGSDAAKAPAYTATFATLKTKC